eukprot:6078343-Pleurochrysis_carterae.AAC.1
MPSRPVPLSRRRVRAWPVVGSQEAERVAAIVHGDGLAVGHLPDHLGGGRQVVHDEVDAVVLADALPQQRNLLGAQLLAAEHLEVTLAHANLVRRVLNDGAVQHLAQVLNRVRDLGRLAKRERVVVVRELRAKPSAGVARACRGGGWRVRWRGWEGARRCREDGQGRESEGRGGEEGEGARAARLARRHGRAAAVTGVQQLQRDVQRRQRACSGSNGRAAAATGVHRRQRA